MNRIRTPLTAVAVAIAMLGVSRGDTRADLTAALKAAAKDPHPQAAFWRSVRAMPDFHVTGDEFRQAIATGGETGIDPFFATFIPNAVGFTKRNGAMAVDLDPRSPVTLATPNGRLVAREQVSFRISQSGDRVVLDQIVGLNVQTPQGVAPRIESVAFRPGPDRQPVMDMTGRLGNTVDTQSINLASLVPPPSNTQGIVGALDGKKGPGQEVAPATSSATATCTSGTTAACTSADTTAATGSSSKYEIQLGDTLWDIGQAYGMTVDQLLDYDGGTGVTNRERLEKTAKSPKHRGDPDWIWNPQEILLPKRDEAVTPKRHDWNRSKTRPTAAR